MCNTQQVKLMVLDLKKKVQSCANNEEFPISVGFFPGLLSGVSSQFLARQWGQARPQV